MSALLLLLSAAVVQCKLPGEILDLSMWYLTLPIGTPGNLTKPLDIYAPELRTYQLPDNRKGYAFVGTFAGNAILFKSHVGGVASYKGTSPYARCELREMAVPDSTKKAWWSLSDGPHLMQLRQAIYHLPPNKHDTVIAQIHDPQNDVLEIQLIGNVLSCTGSYLSSYGAPLDSNYVLGTVFDIKIIVLNGFIYVYYNDMNTPKVTLDHRGTLKGAINYFKTGAYTHSNLEFDIATEYSEVHLFSWHIEHTPLPFTTLPTSKASTKAVSRASTKTGLKSSATKTSTTSKSKAASTKSASKTANKSLVPSSSNSNKKSTTNSPKPTNAMVGSVAGSTLGSN